LLARIAAAGRLRVSVEHAARMVHAGGLGVTCSLIATPAAERDARVSTAMREAVIAAITVPAPIAETGAPSKAQKARASKRDGQAPPGEIPVVARAVALREALDEIGGSLSPGERQLLGEWLDRIADEAS
jgi:hypothetical protein